jgi:2-oxoglutarate ferredoxin oxidoreductase subunit gamma
MTAAKDRYEVILAGSGGQGLVVSGMMLAEAAMLGGKNVVQTVSYGVASRGGFSKAEVIVDREEIIFQQVQNPDIVLALTGEAMEIYEKLAGSGVPVFYDTTLLKTRTGSNLYGFPFTGMAEQLGHAGTANMIALGAMSAVSGVVNRYNLIKVINKRFSGQAADMNVRALHSGIELVK